MLDFDFDWIKPDDVRGAELLCTWASLEIRVGEAVLTRVFDRKARTVRGFIFVPLYPLAEWLATNWWFLSHEFENPEKDGMPSFRSRHSLGAAREGYGFPNLDVHSTGAQTRLRWTKDSAVWTGTALLEHGEAWLDTEEFREECADFISCVIRRLDSFDIEDTLLQREWSVIQAAEEAEVAFCRTAAGLGWDPYALDNIEREKVFSLANILQGCMLEEAIPALNTENFRVELDAIASSLEEARTTRPSLRHVHVLHDRIHDASHTLRIPQERPRSAGYRMAQNLRSALDLNDGPLSSMECIGDALDEDLGEFMNSATSETLAGTALVDGIVARSENNSPIFLFRQTREGNKSFQFSRALCEALMPQSSDTLLTRARTDRQQRNRAFAAEFLAPSSGLRGRVPRSVLGDDDIDEIAAEYGVSPLVMAHQIRNHEIAEIR